MPTTLTRMTLPTLLERYRIYTIRELSRRTGISSKQAWNLWHGVVGLGRITIKRFHEKLGIPTDELLQVESPPPRPRGRPRTWPPEEGQP